MQSFMVIVFAAILFSGFSWGDQAQEKQSAPAPAQTTRTQSQETSRSAVPYGTSTPSKAAATAISNDVRAKAQGTAAPAQAYNENADLYESRASKDERPSRTDTRENRPKETAANLTAPAAAGATGFPTELISSLAQGDEETRRARIESLKRLSMALTQMRSAQEPAPAPAAVAETSPKRRRDRN